MLFKMADTNNDGQISQKEAIDAGNLLVGGFFFRADQNGDGVAQPGRGASRPARPVPPAAAAPLRREKAKAGCRRPEDGTTPTPNPAKAIGNLSTPTTTSRSRRPNSARRSRRASRAFRRGRHQPRRPDQPDRDQRRDHRRRPGPSAQAAFQQADTDNNGQISQAEFDKAIIEPANVVFAHPGRQQRRQDLAAGAQTAEQIIASSSSSWASPSRPTRPGT